MGKKFEMVKVNESKKAGTTGKQAAFIVVFYLFLFFCFPKAFLMIGIAAFAGGLILGTYRALKRKEPEKQTAAGEAES